MPRFWPSGKNHKILNSILLVFLFCFSFGFIRPVTGSSLPVYFQQYVKFDIEVELIPDLHRLEANQTLLYVNNSPDVLRELFFYLYWNKYRANSYARPFASYDEASIDIISLTDQNGKKLDYSIDNTVLWLPLPESLAPGDSIYLNFEFNAVLPESKSRFGYSGDHYDVGNWYPVPAVYDRFGWHTQQHIDGEFYQEWGDYRVNITVPKDFVVGATGELLNPDALPDSVEIVGREIDYYESYGMDTTKVVYHFEARNVHDFAWSANPDFVLIKRQFENTTLNFLSLSYRVNDWEEIADDIVRGFQFIQEKIGPYPYSQLTIVDGFVTAGGIEYPNIVFINDYITDVQYLAIVVLHEIAHQWFYGLLANNQVRYGWMDEGFTSFFEIWVTEYLWGTQDNLSREPQTFWQRLFGYSRNARHDALLDYYSTAIGGREEPINLRFDFFQHDPYTPYYDKMAVVLFALKDMLGDSLFVHAVQEYYREWRFRHPYPEDLYRSFDNSTGMDLSWFWEQWLNTTWKCDYKIENVVGDWKTGPEGREYEALLHLSRTEPIVMPVQLEISLKDGNLQKYRIPVAEMLRGKKADTDLPAWHYSNKHYVARLNLPAEIERVRINPNQSVLDINPFNNEMRLIPKIKFHWLNRQYINPHLDAYTTTILPFVFYNDVDGPQIGIRTAGNFIYPLYQHSSQFLAGLKSGKPSVHLEWENPLLEDNTRIMYKLQGYNLAGRRGGNLEINNGASGDWQWKGGWQFSRLFDSDYLLYPWSAGQISSLYLSFNRDERRTRRLDYSYRIGVSGETSTFGSNFNFQQLRFGLGYSFDVTPFRRFEIEMRGGFSHGDVPLQNLFYIGQASPVNRFDHPYMRARGNLPVSLIRNGHFMVPGGGDIRSSLITPIDVNQTGKHFLAAGMKLDILNPLHILPVDIPVLTFLELYTFTSWAEVWNAEFLTDEIGGEWGIGISYRRIPLWLRYFHISEIFMDFPLWMNKPQPGEESWQFRWNLRIAVETFL